MKVLVAGSAGFIGGHLARYLSEQGHDVMGVDRHMRTSVPYRQRVTDLTQWASAHEIITSWRPQVIYQLATDMGGADYIFTGAHDASVMRTGVQINLNVLEAGRAAGVERFFFSSSACVYNQAWQTYAEARELKEGDAYPAQPDSEYGWEKLFSERLYAAYARNYGLSVHLARFHSIVGPECTWRGGREKVMAALCRKVAEAEDGGEIQIYGDGQQTRTFLHVQDCVEAVVALTESEHQGPFNIGSPVLISINDLAKMIMQVAEKDLTITHIEGPLGVRGRCSDNSAIREAIGWGPRRSLYATVEETYRWVAQQVEAAKEVGHATAE